MSEGFRLSDEEIAAVVERAHEIHSLESRLDTDRSELEQYVKVAEEMGVPRAAMEKALSERFVFLEESLEAGMVVFAKSGDGHSYPATVVSSNESSVSVRFFNGGEGTVGKHELQRASFSPGTVYDYHSPLNAMYVKAPVARYDRENLTVTFNTWGIEESVPLAKVRLRKPSKGFQISVKTWMIAVASLLVGGAVGAVVTALMTR